MAFRVGIVGCGWISSSHIKGYEKVEDVEIAAVCDVIKERAEQRAAEAGGAAVYTDYRAMIKNAGLDAIDICTPPFMHKEVALAAAEAGIHVYCEKPLAPYASDAREMAQACREAGVCLTVGSGRRRVSGEAQAARRAIAQGLLGEVYLAKVGRCRSLGRPGYDMPQLASWFFDSSKAGGGTMYDIGCYDVNLILYLTGAPQPRTISAMAYQGFEYDGRFDHPFDVEEHAVAFVRCDNLSIVIESAWARHAPPEDRDAIRVYGNKAGLTSLTTLARATGFNKVEEIPLEPAEPIDFYEDFVRACQEGRDPISPGEDAVKEMEILSGALLSAYLGREVSVEEVYEIESLRSLPTRGWVTRRSPGAINVSPADKAAGL